MATDTKLTPTYKAKIILGHGVMIEGRIEALTAKNYQDDDEAWWGIPANAWRTPDRQLDIAMVPTPLHIDLEDVMHRGGSDDDWKALAKGITGVWPNIAVLIDHQGQADHYNNGLWAIAEAHGLTYLDAVRALKMMADQREDDKARRDMEAKQKEREGKKLERIEKERAAAEIEGRMQWP